MFFISVRNFGLFVPQAWVGSKLIELPGDMWAGFIAYIIVGIAAFTYLQKTYTQISMSQKQQATTNTPNSTAQ